MEVRAVAGLDLLIKSTEDLQATNGHNNNTQRGTGGYSQHFQHQFTYPTANSYMSMGLPHKGNYPLPQLAASNYPVIPNYSTMYSGLQLATGSSIYLSNCITYM